MPTRRPLLATAALFVFLVLSPLLGFSPLQIDNPQAQDQTVPLDLTPLLAVPQSEMRMVVQRYNLDRTTLSGNYANGGGRGGGRGGRGRGGEAGAAPAPPRTCVIAKRHQPEPRTQNPEPLNPEPLNPEP